MTRLVFLDCETTGLALDAHIWEIAAIIRDPGCDDIEHQFFVEHDPEQALALPERFRNDLLNRYDPEQALTAYGAAKWIVDVFGANRPHIVGAVPNFDTERLARLLGIHGFTVPWHYHLIDVEALAVGYLAGCAREGNWDAGLALPSLPWSSDDLSRACGVEPPTTERHTALGDARWARDLFDAVTGGRYDA